MKMLKTGDKCPCCGQPIVTEDEIDLLKLTIIEDLLRKRTNKGGKDADDHG